MANVGGTKIPLSSPKRFITPPRHVKLIQPELGFKGYQEKIGHFLL